MVSQLKTPLREAAFRFAPELFQAGLAAWLISGEPPDDELLCAILKNDLGRAFAFLGHDGEWRLVHACLVWLYNFAPHGSYGSAQAFDDWRHAFRPLPRITLNGKRQ